MNNIKANFCSRNQIENCNECLNGMDNYHLFQCTWKLHNTNNISYEQIQNGTIVEQKIGIKFIINMIEAQSKKTQMEINCK